MFWLVILSLWVSLAGAEEKPSEPVAKINILDPQAALPFALAHAHGMSKGLKCKEQFASFGADIEKELVSGEWTLIWVNSIAGDTGRVVGITSCLGYKTFGLTPAAFIFGPVQVGAVIIHEMAHHLGCKPGHKQGLSEAKVEKLTRTCLDEYIESSRLD